MAKNKTSRVAIKNYTTQISVEKTISEIEELHHQLRKKYET